MAFHVKAFWIRCQSRSTGKFCKLGIPDVRKVSSANLNVLQVLHANSANPCILQVSSISLDIPQVLKVHLADLRII